MLNDLRLAVRALRRAPAFALAAAITLALGIGATTALFTAVRGVLLRPLPYARSEQIVQIQEVNPKGTAINVTDPNVADWRRDSRTLRALAEYNAGPAVVTSGGLTANAGYAAVSRDFFDVFGVRPVVGRAFVPEEQQVGADPAAIVSDAFWRRTLGASPNFGRITITVDGTRARVVGVMPAGFDFPSGTDVWVPRELDPPNRFRTSHNWQAVGRVVDGLTPATAQRELTALTRALKRQYGSDMTAVDAKVLPLREALVGEARGPLLLLFSAASVLLLVAATNVATLLTARAESQRRELGMRVAVGATGARLARQFVAEAAVLAGAGGALGLVVAVFGTRALGTAGDAAAVPRAGDVRVDALVVAFAFAVAVLLTGIIGGAVAARAARDVTRNGASLVSGDRSGTTSRSGTRVRSTLIAAQVAFTAVLLVGTGLLARSFVRLMSVDPGFRTSGAVALSLAIPSPARGDSGADLRTRQTVDALVTRLRALPGVRTAGGTVNMPIGDGGGGGNGTYVVQTRPDEVRGPDDAARLAKDPSRAGNALRRSASDGYFEAMRIPLIRGRTFTASDAVDAPPVAVISASLARTRFAGQDPLGKLLQVGNWRGDYRPLTIVGVVGDVRESGLDAAPDPTIYVVARQHRGLYAFTVVLAGAPGFDAVSTAAAAQRVARAVAPGFIATARPIEEVLVRSVATRRYALLLAGAFGATALALAITGLYGVVAYVAAQRRRERGGRGALGARAADVRRLVLGRGLAPAAVGLGAGLIVALGLGRVLAAQLYEVDPADPVTYAAVALALGTVAVVAAWGPAARAARADPLVALRAE